MKVIDLLNKIANNEEVPKKIKYSGNTYIYKTINTGRYDYYDIEDNDNLTYALYLDEKDLNDEIEIIEEKPKKIEKLTKINPNVQHMTFDLVEKINEVIDYLLEKESDK